MSNQKDVVGKAKAPAPAPSIWQSVCKDESLYLDPAKSAIVDALRRVADDIESRDSLVQILPRGVATTGDYGVAIGREVGAALGTRGEVMIDAYQLHRNVKIAVAALPPPIPDNKS